MARRVKLEDALRGAEGRFNGQGGEEEVLAFLDAMKKRRTIWWILTIIPGLHFIFGSFLIYTRNTIRSIESGKQPGGLINTIIALWTFIIPTIVMNWVIKILGGRFQDNVVLGCGELLKTYHY